MTSSSEEELSKVKTSLRAKNVKLWLPPYSDNDGNPCQEKIENIVKEISEETSLPEETVSRCINNLRMHSIERLRKKKENIVNIKIKHSQRDHFANQPSQVTIEVRLDMIGEELKSIVAEKLGITDDVKLICSGRVIEDYFTLQSQRVRSNSVILCLSIKKSERQESNELEKALNEVQRARRGAELLAEAGADNHATASGFDIEIEDQKGQVLDIPLEEKQALTIALGLHEKGRAILKRKEYELALLLLLEADREFEGCRFEILTMVDNYAVLCLDIVWCYVCSKNISALPDARARLEKCEKAFKKSYGESLQRLLAIKGSSGNEISLFVRLYVLQAVVNYHDGNYQECKLLLDKSRGYANMVIADQDKVMTLMQLGLSAREARRSLRANTMNVTLASEWAFKQREEHREIKKREKEKKRKKRLQKEFGPCANGDPVNIDSYEQIVKQMGFEAALVVEALKNTNNVVGRAIQMISTNPDQLRQAAEENEKQKTIAVKRSAIEQLKAMGFNEATVRACLHHFSGHMEEAAEYLTNITGEIPDEWIEEFNRRNDGEGSSSRYTEDEIAMMHDLAQDVTQKEDEYLDTMLEEEMSLIEQYRTMLTSIMQQ